MNGTHLFLLSLSIVFAAILGVIRFRKMDPDYHPFIYYVWLGLIVEIAAYILLSNKKENIVSYLFNFFAIGEFYLLTLLFYNWGLFKRKKTVFISIISVSILLYASTMFIRGYDKVNYFARIVNSFALIFFSISAFNKMILNERSNIFKNSKFWICIGIVIFYTYFILVYTEKLSFLNIKRSTDFVVKVWQINAYANLLVNLLYAVAVVWIPRKKNIITLL